MNIEYCGRGERTATRFGFKWLPSCHAHSCDSDLIADTHSIDRYDARPPPSQTRQPPFRGQPGQGNEQHVDMAESELLRTFDWNPSGPSEAQAQDGLEWPQFHGATRGHHLGRSPMGGQIHPGGGPYGPPGLQQQPGLQNPQE